MSNKLLQVPQLNNAGIKERTSSIYRTVRANKINQVESLRKMDVKTAFVDEGIDKYYKKGEIMGEGGSCSVFRGTHKKTGMKVAIKETCLTDYEHFHAAWMLKEIQFLKSIDHPNIVKIHEYFVSKTNILSIVLEHCEGQELAKMIEKHYIPFKEEEAGIIFSQLVKAVFYMHQNNLCHRDLKLENIIIDPRYKENILHVNTMIKVIDLGTVVKNVNNKGFTGGVGTANYIAPEILYGQVYNEQCDIWSLGVCLFVLLSAKMPFGHEVRDPEIIYERILKCDYEFNKFLFITDEIKALVKRMLT